MGQEPDKAEFEVTPAMIEAGAARLTDLLSAGTSSAYVAEEVY
ncbi:MAG: hypothetical protein JWR47_3423, partial [Phenylobacterium sp.]|nr:hypothetical protein [Phenylobacterium sp.]